MKKFYKFLKSFIFISFWLILTSSLTGYWNFFHYEYIFSNIQKIFDKEFWFVLENFLLGFDIGYWLEEGVKFLSLNKYIPNERYSNIGLKMRIK